MEKESGTRTWHLLCLFVDRSPEPGATPPLGCIRRIPKLGSSPAPCFVGCSVVATQSYVVGSFSDLSINTGPFSMSTLMLKQDTFGDLGTSRICLLYRWQVLKTWGATLFSAFVLKCRSLLETKTSLLTLNLLINSWVKDEWCLIWSSLDLMV